MDATTLGAASLPVLASATPLSAAPLMPGIATADALGGGRCAGAAMAPLPPLPPPRAGGIRPAFFCSRAPYCICVECPSSRPRSGQKDTPAAAGALPIGWPAAAAVQPPDGPVATLNDRRVRLGPAGAADEQQPSLYRLCRQWVQNDPDLPAELVEVSGGGCSAKGGLPGALYCAAAKGVRLALRGVLPGAACAPAALPRRCGSCCSNTGLAAVKSLDTGSPPAYACSPL